MHMYIGILSNVHVKRVHECKYNILSISQGTVGAKKVYILFPLHGTNGVLERKRNVNETETKRNLSLKTEDRKRKSVSARVNCMIAIMKQ